MLEPMSKDAAALFVDYPINLLEVRDSDQFHFDNEEVDMVFSISRDLYRYNLDKVKEIYADRQLEKNVIDAIAAITNTPKLRELKSGKGESKKMCTRVDEFLKREREKAVEEKNKEIKEKEIEIKEAIKDREEAIKGHEEAIKGREEAINDRTEAICMLVESLKEMSVSTDVIVDKLVSGLGISEVDARLYL